MENLEIIQTQRLLARRIRADDFEFVLRMNQDEKVMAFIGGIRSEAKTREYLAEAMEHWTQRGYGTYIVHDAAAGVPIGRAALRLREVDGVWENDIGYSFMPAAWGKGFATEIGTALVQIGFERLGFDSMTAFTATTNTSSRRVMEKLGFLHEKDFVFAGESHVLYRIPAPLAAP